ncbi:MAG: MBL fold metallo-hydrolase [Alphaproteobacteria bacterium]|nr:MBL fold metallo-hydrolase [Alphaproteobacteria bacterium]
MTTIDAIADGIYRISTPLAIPGGAFSFNQYLVVDDAPFLFHTGPRKLFAETRAAIQRVMPVDKLRYVGLSHFEADECGALNEFLAVAPQAEPLCGRIAAMVSVGDYADRAPRALADGEELSLGKRVMRWCDTPHVPHGWECGFAFETRTRTLLCGDLFTQGGADNPALTTADILGPSEAFRQALDYFAHAPDTRATLNRLADLAPRTLACMHGSAWEGDGGALLQALAERVEATRPRAAA